MKDFLQGKWLGHPPHPALVHIPTSLWPAALVFDLLSYYGIGGNTLVQLSFYSILLGLITAVIAIPFGLADWWGIGKDKPAWTLGVFHMILNLLGASLWSLNLGLRIPEYLTAQSSSLPLLLLSGAGVALLIVSGYLGGRMVFGYGASVARLSKDKWKKIALEGGGRSSDKSKKEEAEE
jgi:uncharacterized membrane protein